MTEKAAIGLQLATAALCAVSVALVGAIFAQTLSQATTLGEHSKTLQSVEASVAGIDATIAAAKAEIIAEYSSSQNSLRGDADFLKAQNAGMMVQMGELKRVVEASSIDLPALIAKLGFVEQSDIMHAVIYNGSIFAVPSSPDAIQKLLNAGLKREMIMDTVSAFKVAPASLAMPDATVAKP
ncbi:hypothetical protein [Pararhizobium sp. O133]|uniref:hypothetical protein n=1 Tax=Pararhizobium sp. O133 TaxID=3449278 RepID=UPI003F683CAD